MELGQIDFFEQQKHLKKVSRTFALTIPLLPSPLDDYISNAYLLCRIADTVEDDPLASPEKKVQWLNEFSSFCRGGFSDEMELLRLHRVAMELVKAGAVENEYLLVKDMPNVVMRTVSYNNSIKKILSKGVSILSSGMADSIKGYSISTLEDVDKYCYYVAGVIGEVLALLFCEYNHSIDRKKLLSLSVSFGEGLQLTNILKDRYQDQKRNVSFLPAVAVEKQQEQIEEYSAICQGHLDDALSFILSIPKEEDGIRFFCLLNIAMATATLSKIQSSPLDTKCAVKITRRKVKFLFFCCKIVKNSNFLVKFFFRLLSSRAKRIRRNYEELRQRVSVWDKFDNFPKDNI